MSHIVPSQEDIDVQLQILKSYRQVLIHYLRQQARWGSLHVPAHIVSEIHEARKNIHRVKNILNSWGVEVINHPIDEEEEKEAARYDLENTYIQEKSALPVFLESVTDLFGENLSRKMIQQRDNHKEILLEIYSTIKSIEHFISDIVLSIDMLNYGKYYDGYDDKFAISLINAKYALSHVVRGIKLISPEFEIMAQNTALIIEGFINVEIIFVNDLGLLRKKYRSVNNEITEESLVDYKKRLQKVREQAEAARESLAEFIRKSYTWSDFGS